MYDTVSELLAEIAAGEDAYLEFKEATFRGSSLQFKSEKANAQEAMVRVLCSFANAEGGVLVLGVN